MALIRPCICEGCSEALLVACWKSHALAHILWPAQDWYLSHSSALKTQDEAAHLHCINIVFNACMHKVGKMTINQIKMQTCSLTM